jgi:hypothetical protein
MKGDADAILAELRRKNGWPAKGSKKAADDQRKNMDKTAWLAQCIPGDGQNAAPLPVLANALIGLAQYFPTASPTTRRCARRS